MIAQMCFACFVAHGLHSPLHMSKQYVERLTSEPAVMVICMGQAVALGLGVLTAELITGQPPFAHLDNDLAIQKAMDRGRATHYICSLARGPHLTHSSQRKDSAGEFH